jgi:hypothetical protein
MRTKMTQVFPETALERILEALEHELVAATDEEILEAANDLGMKPRMKGSAAFLGLRYPAARAEEFFDPQWMLRVLNDPRRIWLAGGPSPAKPAQPRGAPARAAPRTRLAGRRPSRPPKEPREN